MKEKIEITVKENKEQNNLSSLSIMYTVQCTDSGLVKACNIQQTYVMLLIYKEHTNVFEIVKMQGHHKTTLRELKRGMVAAQMR